MTRLRILFEKRGWASFIRHVELPQLLGRMARRAGLTVEMTQGFSPHPHIVMGPALPVGVLSLGELAELWIDGPEDGFCQRMNDASPTGLRILTAQEVEGPALNKVITAASYWISPRDEAKIPLFEEKARDVYGDSLVQSFRDDGLVLTLLNPSSAGLGQLVRPLVEDGVVADWGDLRAVRLGLGRWDGRALVPLLEASDE